MAPKKKKNLLKQFLIVSGVLCLAQIIFLAYYSSLEGPETVKEALTAPESNLNLKKKVQLAINDYRSKNKELPKTLAVLVPDYFEEIPIDPDTKKPFTYRVDGKKYFLGDMGKGGTEVKNAPVQLEGDALKNALTVINEDSVKSRPLFNPEGKRDPFRPYDPDPSKGVNQAREPLESYSIDDLRLTAVIESGDEPAASIEAPDGTGYMVKKGMKIGTNGGTVTEIKGDRVTVVESSTDFTGEEKTKTREIMIKGSAKSTSGQAPKKSSFVK